jgi:EAL domain-containing protein (putative c-di-GMP-specific phosphodiesterase class I)
LQSHSAKYVDRYMQADRQNGGSGRIRIIVADDDPSIRARLRHLLNVEPDLEVVGAASDGREALQLTMDLRPDVLVLDQEMPLLTGLAVLERLRRECPSVYVVVYPAESAICEQALQAGARACVPKDAPTKVLVDAIRTVNQLDTAELRETISTGGLVVAFQPLVELASGAPRRFEALCRWPHPTRGEISPIRFITFAEERGLITPLTLFVVQAVATAAAAWRGARPTLGVSFNLSLVSLLDPTFPDALTRILGAVGCDPAALGVEITESTLLREPVAVAVALGRLRAMGMRVEIDDFGTGYSSLGRLIDLPVDALKIDRRFVGQMTRDRKSQTIVRACINLAHDLGLEAVAEGVADRETWELLGTLGCDIAQGYYVARARPQADVAEWLSSWEAGLGVLQRERIGHDLVSRTAPPSPAPGL